MNQILEWHRSRRMEMDVLEMPYSMTADMLRMESRGIKMDDDDGHRPIRLFARLPDGSVEFRAHFCLCGLFVDMKYNPDGFFRVFQCGRNPHFGCEVLLPEGIQSPYLLADNYRDYVRPAETHYIYTQERDSFELWDRCMKAANHELEQFLTQVS